MSSPTKTVEAYYEAFGRKDFKRVRELLSPGFTFKGPMMAFDGADAFLQAMGQMPFEATHEGSKFIVDGDRLACTFLWKMTAPAIATIPMCEVLELSGGKILSSELYYDSKLFPAPPSGGKS